MKEIRKAHIRLAEYAVDIEEVKSISVSLDNRMMMMIVDAEGREYATAIQNVLIITEVVADAEIH